MTSKHGAFALHAGLARLHASMRMYTPTHSRTHIHARTHTETNKLYSFCFSTATMNRERASVLRYTYVVCLVLLMQIYYYSDRLKICLL